MITVRVQSDQSKRRRWIKLEIHKKKVDGNDTTQEVNMRQDVSDNNEKKETTR